MGRRVRLIHFLLLCIVFMPVILLGWAIFKQTRDPMPEGQRWPDKYHPRQDTSPHMYNKHGVHKYNPNLDK